MCVDSIESAVNAENGGACRIELCSNLGEGGTTPSLGLLRVVKKILKVPIFVMIRPRGGDFFYSNKEFTVMEEDLKVVKENGADGIVFGLLTKEGDIDIPRTKILLNLARPLPVTFHRAFDMVRDPEKSLDALIELGVERVLTSGLDTTALEGLPTIVKLVKKAQGSIIVVPGGGINERNLKRILSESGAREYHCSARSSFASCVVYRNSRVHISPSFGPVDFKVKFADEKRVSDLVAIGSEVWGEKRN